MKRLGVVAGIIGAGLAIGEVLARTVFALQTPGQALALYEPDSHADYRLVAGRDLALYGHRVHLNAHGIRDVEFDADKPAGTFRIVGLGDSFAFGGAVAESETFYKLCETTLRERFRTRAIELLNAGCPSYGTWQEAALLEHRALAWKPDAVVLQVFMWNDVFESMTQGTFVVQDGFLVRGAIADDLAPMYRTLVAALDHSALFRLVRARTTDKQEAGEGGRARTGGFNDRTRARLFVAGQRQVAPLAAPWSAFIAQLRGIAAIARDHNLPLAVLCVPSHREVHRATRAAWIHRIGFPSDRIDIAGPWNDVVAVCANDGALVVDLGPALRALPDETIDALYLPDGHFSAKGHAFAADRLARALIADPRFAPAPK